MSPGNSCVGAQTLLPQNVTVLEMGSDPGSQSPSRRQDLDRDTARKDSEDTAEDLPYKPRREASEEAILLTT